MYMFSSQLTLADLNDICEFQEGEGEVKWKGAFVSALHSILKQVHNSLNINSEALLYVENLILKLLNLLCSKPVPQTIQDIEEKIKTYFPNPINEWSFNEARQALEKGKKKSTIVLSIDKVQYILQKEFYSKKIDTNMVLYYSAVLDYIAADLLKLVGNYVKNIQKVDISIEDINIAMYADKALMELFYQEDDDVLYLEPEIQNMSWNEIGYEDVITDFLMDEKLYVRELKLILKIFYDEISKAIPIKEITVVNTMFELIEEIYNFTLCLIGAVEDNSEMSSDEHCIGSCFEEFAEDAEFDVYEKFLHNVITQKSIEVLRNHVMKSEVMSVLQSAGNGIKECIKYYLPTLLLSPIYHCNLYFEYIKIFHSLSKSDEDKESLEQVQGLLSPLQNQISLSKLNLDKTVKNSNILRNYKRLRQQQNTDKFHEMQTVVDGLDIVTVKQFCNEFYREDLVMKYDNKSNRHTERKAYFFDGLLILCKPMKKSTVSVPLNVVGNQYEYKHKEMYFLNKVDIYDVDNTDEVENAFEVVDRNQSSVIIVTKSTEDKRSWLSDLIMISTRSLLQRTLNNIILFEEKKHPLRMPSPEIYKFSEPDSSDNIILEEKPITGHSRCHAPLIKGAVLHKMIERMTYHVCADPQLVNTFLITFRSFCTANELLNLLIERFNIPEPSSVFKDNEQIDNSILREDIIKYKREFVQPIQFRVLNVFRQWVSHHFYDFQNDPRLLEQLKSFLSNDITGKSLRKWADSVLSSISRKEQDLRKETSIACNDSPPPVEIHGNLETFDEFNILVAHPVEIARQLTLFEFDLFRSVQPSELVGSVWTKKNKNENSPNLMKIMKHTTNFTLWLEKTIVETKNFEERLAVISRIIEILITLQHLNNFNGILAIVSAMGSAAVYRLKYTFQALPARLVRALEDARDLNNEHFKKYHEKLRSVDPPCIPFFGMYLTNILHIEEGNPDMLPDSNLINFTKRRKVAEIIVEIQQYQNLSYCYKEVPIYREFFENLSPFEGMDEIKVSDFLYNKSLEIEPRDTRSHAQLRKFPRKWPHISLKSPISKMKKTRVLYDLSGEHQEDSPLSEVDEPATPMTPLNNLETNSDFSIFAPIIIGNPENTCTNFEELNNNNYRTVRSASTSRQPLPLPPPHTPPPLPPRANKPKIFLPKPPPRDSHSIPPPLPPRRPRVISPTPHLL